MSKESQPTEKQRKALRDASPARVAFDVGIVPTILAALGFFGGLWVADLCIENLGAEEFHLPSPGPGPSEVLPDSVAALAYFISGLAGFGLGSAAAFALVDRKYGLNSLATVKAFFASRKD